MQCNCIGPHTGMHIHFFYMYMYMCAIRELLNVSSHNIYRHNMHTQTCTVCTITYTLVVPTHPRTHTHVSAPETNTEKLVTKAACLTVRWCRAERSLLSTTLCYSREKKKRHRKKKEPVPPRSSAKQQRWAASKPPTATTNPLRDSKHLAALSL